MPANQGAEYGWPGNWPPAYWNTPMAPMPPNLYPNFVAGAGPAWPPQPQNPPVWPPQPPNQAAMPPHPCHEPNPHPTLPPPMPPNAAQAARRAHRHHAVHSSESDEARDHEDGEGAGPNVPPPIGCNVARYKESGTGVNIESWLYQMEKCMALNGIPRAFLVKTYIANFHPQHFDQGRTHR